MHSTGDKDVWTPGMVRINTSVGELEYQGWVHVSGLFGLTPESSSRFCPGLGGNRYPKPEQFRMGLVITASMSICSYVRNHDHAAWAVAEFVDMFGEDALRDRRRFKEYMSRDSIEMLRVVLSTAAPVLIGKPEEKLLGLHV